MSWFMVLPVNASLVGAWPLDETSGTIAHDASGNVNDGTLITQSEATASPQWVNDSNRGRCVSARWARGRANLGRLFQYIDGGIGFILGKGEYLLK